MAAYAIAAEAVACHEIDVTADVEDSVTITGDCSTVTVLVLSGTEPVYFTVDRSAAAVAGPRCHLAPVGFGTPVEMPGDSAGALVRLISAGAAVVSVERTR